MQVLPYQKCLSVFTRCCFILSGRIATSDKRKATTCHQKVVVTNLVPPNAGVFGIWADEFGIWEGGFVICVSYLIRCILLQKYGYHRSGAANDDAKQCQCLQPIYVGVSYPFI